MANVTLSNIEKNYPNGFHAIKGVDLNINDGELLVVVGPSGCGKSTLLRMIAGLETISAGELSIDHQVVNQLEPAERDIAMVFQNYALYPHMSVYKNMAYGLKNRKVSADEIERRVNEVATILELDQLLNRKPSQLSGGQRQRVAMGRAIVRKPKVFLFDEPLSNLDAKLRGQMRIEIKQLQRRLSTTAIYVTHDQVEAMTLADRLVVMNNGIPEQIGTPAELYNQPETLFVAGFLGTPSINLFAGTLTPNGFSLPDNHRIHLTARTADKPATLGVRAEDLRLCAQDEADFEMVIELVEHLGSEMLAIGKLKGTQQKITARLKKTCDAVEGDILPLSIDRNHWHWFDTETGRRFTPALHRSQSLSVLTQRKQSKGHSYI